MSENVKPPERPFLNERTLRKAVGLRWQPVNEYNDELGSYQQVPRNRTVAKARAARRSEKKRKRTLLNHDR